MAGIALRGGLLGLGLSLVLAGCGSAKEEGVVYFRFHDADSNCLEACQTLAC